MKHILVVDIGGTNIKIGTSGRRVPIKIPSGKTMTAARMGGAGGGAGRGWMRVYFGKAFGAPVKIVNDAAMQALGAYAGGRMLFLGLGTGLGSALVAEGLLMPLELAHLAYRRGRTYEDYLGMRGFVRLGRKKWTRHVHEVVDVLKGGLQADYVVLGGGQTKKLKTLPPGVRIS